MSIDLRHGIFENFKGELEHSSTVSVFDVKKIWIDQRYDEKDKDEVFTLYLSEDNGTVHKFKLYPKAQNTEITLTPDAERRLNTIPQAARGSIVNLVVPNDAIDEKVLQNDIDNLKRTRTVCSNEMATPYRSDDVVKNTTPNN